MSQNDDLQNWGKRLDAGDTEDPLLALAARLREENTSPPPPAAQFKAELRAQLIEQHAAAQPRRFEFPRLRAHPIALPAALVFVIVVLFMTPLPSKAAQFLSGLFSLAPSDEQAYATPLLLNATPTPVVTPIYTPPPSIAEVQAQADFHVKVPTWLPAGYEFQGAEYSIDNASSTWQDYMNNNHQNGFILMQMPVEAAESFEVGASAAVIPISINGHAGEYVEGGWVAVTGEVDDTAALTGQVWDPDYPFQQLRWTEGDMAFLLMSYVGSPKELTRDQWIKIAENLR